MTRLTAIVLLVATALAEAQSPDDALIRQLEAATSSAEYHEAGRALRKRLDSGPLSTKFSNQLIRVLTSRQGFSDRAMLAILGDIAARRPLSESAINAIAASLSGNVVQGPSGAKAIQQILNDYQRERELPSLAFVELVNALGHRAVLNQYAAIDVLSQTRTHDPRRDRAVDALTQVVATHELQRTRIAAASGLARLAADAPISERSTDTLIRTATRDDAIAVRIAALEALMVMPIDRDKKAEVGRKVSNEIVAPTMKVWGHRSNSLRPRIGSSFEPELHSRAARALFTWFAPNPPSFVVDALVACARYHRPTTALELLEKVRLADDLNDAHRTELERIAVAHREPATREAIYRLSAANLTPGSLLDATSVMETASSTDERIRAAYRIKRDYSDGGLPEHAADAAERVLRSGPSRELRGVAAVILANSERPVSAIEVTLIAAIRDEKNKYNDGIVEALVDLYGDDGLQRLVARYAGDRSLLPWVRMSLVDTLAKERTAHRVLAATTHDALEQAAWNTSNYALVATIKRTLDAYGAKIPWIVTLKSRTFQSTALFVLLAVCALLNAGASILLLVTIGLFPLRGDSRIVKRGLLLICWLICALAVLAALTLGFVGFIGHNSAPSPPATLELNIPAYVATAIHLALAIALWLAARRRRREQAATDTDPDLIAAPQQ